MTPKQAEGKARKLAEELHVTLRPARRGWITVEGPGGWQFRRNGWRATYSFLCLLSNGPWLEGFHVPR